MGLAVWALADAKLVVGYARDNAISKHTRALVFLNIGVGMGVALALCGAILLWKRRAALGLLDQLARRAAPLALAGLAVFLFDARLWADREAVFLPLALAFGLGMRAAVAASLDAGLAFPAAGAAVARAWARVGDVGGARLRAFRGADVALAVVGAGAAGYAWRLSALTLADHRNFGTSSFDLGGFDNLMWNLVHGAAPFRSTPFMGYGGSHLARHATFLGYALAPIYAAFPGAETLLVLQATILGATAVPMHLTLRRYLPHWASALLSLLFLTYAPLHGANLYDFHFLTLGVFFLWLIVYAVEAERPWLVVLAAVLGISVREDVAACVAVLGAALLLTGRAPRTGLGLAVAAGGYFLLMKLVIMPHVSTEGETFVAQYAVLMPQGERSLGSALKTIVANPPFTANVLFERDKLVYLMQLFVPVLFLPWRRPLAMLLFLPGTMFSLLTGAAAPLTQISFQYHTYWTAFVFLLTGLELARVARPRHEADERGPRRLRAMLAGVAAASLACSYVYGALLPHAGLRGGFDPVRLHATDFDLRRRDELAALIPQIPRRASIAASEKLVSHVSARPDVFTLRYGVLDASYLLFEVPPRADEKGQLLEALRKGTFGVVDDRGDLVLAQRGHDVAKNAAVVRRL